MLMFSKSFGSSGRIVWVRSLRQRLGYLMDEATGHLVLKVMPEMADVQKKFATMSTAFLNYEEEIKSVWMNHNVSVFCIPSVIVVRRHAKYRKLNSYRSK